MSNSRSLEVLVGIFVSAGMVALAILAFNVSNMQNLGGGSYYTVTASFTNVSGLKERSSVSIAGVSIGRVISIDVDPESFEAVVTMRIEERFNEIPVDSDAGIYTAGLLGEKYVGISNGGAPDFLEEGGEIRLTQSSLVLEKLISQFLFSKSSEE